MIGTTRWLTFWRAVLVSHFCAMFCSSVLAAPDLAFYYGSRPPVQELRHFDQVVVQPNQLLPEEKAALLAAGPLIVAYVSVGEVARNSVDFVSIQNEWVIGRNSAWDSLVMDYRHAGWQNYLLEKQFRALWQQGFRAFFLDTMDSYLLVEKDGIGRQAQEHGLRDLLQRIKHSFPGVKLIVNRGFDVLDSAHPYVDGVVAEAYFAGWEPQNREYKIIPEQERYWLHQRLEQVQKQYNIPVTVVDYAAPGDLATAEKYARDILAAGFTPWVANGDLTQLGQGRKRVVPRRVLALWDGPVDGLWDHALFRHVAASLEQMGLAIDYVNIELEGLPLEPLSGRYAGVVAWLSERSEGSHSGLCVRLQQEAQAHVRTAFLGELPLADTCKRWLNIETSSSRLSAPLQLQKRGSVWAKAEAPLLARDVPVIRHKGDSAHGLRITDPQQRTADAMVIADFGAYVLQPYLLDEGFEGNTRWMMKPHAFWQAAFQLRLPARFDLSHENGGRLALHTLATDGMDSAQQQNKLDVWVDLIKQFPIPLDIAISEAELTDVHLTTEQREQRLRWLQNLLAVPSTRLVSHGYSHPFYWRTFDGRRDTRDLRHFYTVQQPGYLAELSREISEPPNSFKKWLQVNTSTLFWSGDAKPGPAAIKLAEDSGLHHFGGGGVRAHDQYIGQANRFPLIKSDRFGTQVLAPVLNENSYAELFNDKALRYRDVLRWNQQLSSDRAWQLLWHVDAVVRPNAVSLIQDVQQMALKQNLLPLWMDEYVRRARSWQQASYAIQLDGKLEVLSGDLRNLEWLGNEALFSGNGVAGFAEKNRRQWLYLASHRALVQPGASMQPILEFANAPLLHWQIQEDGRIHFQFRAITSLQFQIRSTRSCQLTANGRELGLRRQNTLWLAQLTAQHAAGELTLDCR